MKKNKKKASKKHKKDKKTIKDIYPKTVQYLDRNESQTGPAPAIYKFLKKVKLDHLSWYSRDFQMGIKSRL